MGYRLRAMATGLNSAPWVAAAEWASYAVDDQMFTVVTNQVNGRSKGQ